MISAVPSTLILLSKRGWENSWAANTMRSLTTTPISRELARILTKARPCANWWSHLMCWRNNFTGTTETWLWICLHRSIIWPWIQEWTVARSKLRSKLWPVPESADVPYWKTSLSATMTGFFNGCVEKIMDLLQGQIRQIDNLGKQTKVSRPHPAQSPPGWIRLVLPKKF